MSEPLPILVPETKRFFAGSADGESDVIVGLKIDDLPVVNVNTELGFDTPDWTDETHSKSADPNHAEVFDDGQVKRLDFVVTSERWQSMLDDMTNTYGEFGQPSSPGLIEAEDPIFVPADIFYNGKQWYRVGIRFKGNSSLQSSWEQGILKLSFKLDFDEFEDDYPQIDNQRFYGFKKFSLKNNYDDESFLREKVASDVFAEAGVEVSHTAFYTLYIDHGNGPEYFGLYTLVENDYLNQVISGPFETSAIQARYDNYSALVQPYAEAERTGYSFLESTNDFTRAISELDAHAVSRATAVNAYLNGQ